MDDGHTVVATLEIENICSKAADHALFHVKYFYLGVEHVNDEEIFRFDVSVTNHSVMQILKMKLLLRLIAGMA